MTPEDRSATNTLERLLIGALLAAAAVTTVFLWLSRLAVALFGTAPFPAGPGDALPALGRLPQHLGDPAAAWAAPFDTALPGPAAYWTVLLLPSGLLVLLGALCWRRVTRHRTSRRQPLGVDPDTGVIARLHRLEVRAPTAGRITLGRVGRRLVAAEAGASLAVVGPSGCGKTVGFAIPALLEWNGPVIATSVKTDLLAATFERRRSMGSVWVYDPTGSTPFPSARWSPLTDCTTWAGAQRTSAWLCAASEPKRSSVTEADYWQNQAQIALAPHLYAAATSGATMSDVVRWIDMQEIELVRNALASAAGLATLVERAASTPDATRLAYEIEPPIRTRAIEEIHRALAAEGAASRTPGDPETWPPPWRERLEQRISVDLDQAVRAELEVLLLRKGGPAVGPLAAAEALWAKEERLRSSVYATIQNILLGYADEAVARAASGCDIDLDRWLTGANTIYIVAPEHDQARLRPVLTVLLASAVRAAYDQANQNSGTLQRPTLVLLDEAGNVAAPKDLPAWVTTARSHGISLVTVWQDLAQIRSIYGDLGNAILSNHKAKVFGSGISDPSTLDLASRLVGDHPLKERNQSQGHAGARSWSEHTTYRRAAPADTIRRLADGNALLIYGNLPPVRLTFR